MRHVFTLLLDYYLYVLFATLLWSRLSEHGARNNSQAVVINLLIRLKLGAFHVPFLALPKSLEHGTEVVTPPLPVSRDGGDKEGNE